MSNRANYIVDGDAVKEGEDWALLVLRAIIIELSCEVTLDIISENEFRQIHIHHP